MMRRWHPDDLPQLSYQALYKLRNEGGQRLACGLADLPDGGMFDDMKRNIKAAAYSEMNEHLRKVFSAEKWNLIRLCSGLSWNVLRWINDVFMWDAHAVNNKGEEVRARHTVIGNSKLKLHNLVPIKEMRMRLDNIVKGELGSMVSDDGRCSQVKST